MPLARADGFPSFCFWPPEMLPHPESEEDFASKTKKRLTVGLDQSINQRVTIDYPLPEFPP